MNGTTEPTSVAAGTDGPCGLSSLIPIGMSCRGRAEAFARRLQSRLRTLGTQSSETTPENEEQSENSWLTQAEQQVTSLQPLRHLSHEADSFFDFDIEPESPGSPAEECEYSRLIETASATPQDPHDVAAPESGYVCASPISPEDARKESTVTTSVSQTAMPNGHVHPVIDSDSCSESLPPSQSTTNSPSTCTGLSSTSNSTLQDEATSEIGHEDHIDIPTEQQNHTDIEEAHHSDDHTNIDTDQALDQDAVEQHPHRGDDGEEKPIENGDETQLEVSHLDNDIEVGACNIKISEEATDSVSIEVDIQMTLASPTVISATPESSPGPETKEEASTECKKEHLSALSTDDEEIDERPQRVRRSSSLKTGKTPPGTPGRKKIVRFADVLGLDLADVRTFMDEVPKIPKSAFEDLDMTEPLDQPISLGPRADKMLMPLFQQPGGLPNFLDIVTQKQVSLENAAVTDPITLTISGSVRVRNLDFHKSVHIRYTTDNWRSFSDLQANYVQNSCDGFSDKFTFIVFGNSLQVGQRIEMAIRFSCKGQQYWDSNYGANYCFQCLPVTVQPRQVQSAPIVPNETDIWCGNFY